MAQNPLGRGSSRARSSPGEGCPGVRDVAVALHTGGSGEPRLVAYVVADRRSATLARLRAFVWSRLPGYACPSEIVVVPHLLPEGDGEVVTGFVSTPVPGHLPRDISPEQSVLTSLWAEVLGVGRVGPEENYWQAFSFLEVLARARDAGLPVAGEPRRGTAPSRRWRQTWPPDAVGRRHESDRHDDDGAVASIAAALAWAGPAAGPAGRRTQPVSGRATRLLAPRGRPEHRRGWPGRSRGGCELRCRGRPGCEVRPQRRLCSPVSPRGEGSYGGRCP